MGEILVTDGYQLLDNIKNVCRKITSIIVSKTILYALGKLVHPISTTPLVFVGGFEATKVIETRRKK